MIYTLVFRCFRICSDWNKFHKEIIFLKDIFLKNGYPTSFIDKCFKTFLDQLFIKKPQVLTVEKKTLTLVLPFLGNLSLQTKTILQNVLKRVLKVKGIFQMFSISKIVNLTNLFLVSFINFSVVDAILPIFVRLIDT